MSNTRDENRGYLFGLMAVVAFAVTLPATRVAVRALDPVFVGLDRGIGAALLAAAFLLLTRQRVPSRTEAKKLVIVAAAVVIGFPLFTAWAMRYVVRRTVGSSSGFCRWQPLQPDFSFLENDRPCAFGCSHWLERRSWLGIRLLRRAALCSGLISLYSRPLPVLPWGTRWGRSFRDRWAVYR